MTLPKFFALVPYMPFEAVSLHVYSTFNIAFWRIYSISVYVSDLKVHGSFAFTSTTLILIMGDFTSVPMSVFKNFLF